MFTIRSARPGDLSDLHTLAKQTYFINLPPDRETIAAKIEQSQRAFATLAGAPRPTPATPTPAKAHGSGMKAVTRQGDLYLLVLEDSDAEQVIGTCQVIARMGGPGAPRVFLQLSTRTQESTSLKLSWTHQFAHLGTDESGPTEIGGLILNHAFRGHRQRLGRFLSFVRFHLIGLFRKRFADRVVAEMLGPIDHNGYNPFFEKFTRHYIPRSFAEVFRFSQTSKEFVQGLMPESGMDLSIMDPEVTNSAGNVADETRPARLILERLGFAYRDRIDPMDGGPHLEAPTDRITLVKATRRLATLTPIPTTKPATKPAKSPKPSHHHPEPTLIASALGPTGDFRAVQSAGRIAGSGSRAALELPHTAADALSHGISGRPIVIGATPLDLPTGNTP